MKLDFVLNLSKWDYQRDNEMLYCRCSVIYYEDLVIQDGKSLDFLKIEMYCVYNV